MEAKQEMIDDRSKGEVAGLLDDCIVQPLRNELAEQLKQSTEAQDAKLETVEEKLKEIDSAAMQLKIQLKKTGNEEKEQLEDLSSSVDGINSAIAMNHEEETDALDELKQSAEAHDAKLETVEEKLKEIDSAAMQLKIQLKKTGDEEKKQLEDLSSSVDGISSVIATNHTEEAKALEALEDEIKNVVECDVRTNYTKLKKLLQDAQCKEENAFRQLTQDRTDADAALQELLEKGLADLNQSICSEMQQGFSETDAKLDQNRETVLRKLDDVLSQLQEGTETGNAQLTECWTQSQTAMETYKKDAEDRAAAKYKMLLGISLSFGIVNFLGIVALLVMNFMQ